MKNFMKNHGQALLDNGFQFVPISTPRDGDKSAGKRPILGSWQKIVVDQDSLDVWKDKYGRNGIGILTKNTPAVDIDSLDVDAAKHMRIFVESTCGFAPIRVGNAPKTLLLYRTDEPFSKVKSAVWTDDWGTDHAVEILGDGQQFVAYGIHPGTKKPYEWVSIESPLVNHASLDLEVITLDDARAIANEFDRYAMEQGWVLKQRATVGNHVIEMGEFGGDDEDPDDWVTADDVKDKWDGTVEELESLLSDLPPEEHYDKWYPVIAALKDAEREPDEFKEIAREWSARAENFDDDGFEDKWDNGNFTRGSGNVATISGIIKRVQKVIAEDEALEELKPKFLAAKNEREWLNLAARFRESEVFGTVRETVIEAACIGYKESFGTKISATTKKRELSFDYTLFDKPEWLEKWVFVSTDNVFLNTRDMKRRNPHAFNNTHAIDTVMAGVTPEVFATTLYPIPIVAGEMYYPGMHGDMDGSRWSPVRGVSGTEFFEYNGSVWLNTFRPGTMPTIAEKFTKKGKQAIEVVKNFFTVQFPDPKEHKYVMDWIAWVINNPCQKINYMLLVLGGQGSGKSIIKKFMQFMLGNLNVGTVSNAVIQKTFTSWQAGDILKVIEELSVPGHRYDIINSIKEPITNESLMIEFKGRDAVQMVNTASYMAFTNDLGALPTTRGDRRFLITQSSFKTKDDVEQYSIENPDFFSDFQQAFEKYPDQIKLWFKSWKYGDYFKHDGHAPTDTNAHGAMIEVAQDDFSVALQDAIEDNISVGITAEVIHTYGVGLKLSERIIPANRHFAGRLADLGYVSPRMDNKRCRVRLKCAGQEGLGSVYVKDPSKWLNSHGEPDLIKIARHLNDHTDRIAGLQLNEDWD